MSPTGASSDDGYHCGRMSDHDYDVIVVGAGSPGEHCAGELADGGLRVAVVERELVGGECSYWACIPSKTLLRPGEAVQGAREAARERRSTCRPRWPGGTSWCPTTRTPGQSWLKSKGIDLLRGTGWLAGPGVVEVDGVRHTARHVVAGHRVGPGHAARSRPARARRRVDQPRGHRR